MIQWVILTAVSGLFCLPLCRLGSRWGSVGVVSGSRVAYGRDMSQAPWQAPELWLTSRLSTEVPNPFLSNECL